MRRNKNAVSQEVPSAPQWLINLSKKILELRHPTLLKSAGEDFARGAFYGHQLAELCVYREPSTAKRPAEGFAVLDPEEDRRLYESQVWIAGQIAEGCNLPRKRAYQFFQGVVFALKPQRRQKMKIRDLLTADIYDILFWNWSAIDALPTRTAIADFVREKLPAHRRQSDSVKASFRERIQKICASIKLTPARRGHPRK